MKRQHQQQTRRSREGGNLDQGNTKHDCKTPPLTLSLSKDYPSLA